LPRVLWIYSVTGEWVYPLFALFSPAGLAAFFAGSLAVIISFYNFGEFLNRMIWGQFKFCFSLLSIWNKMYLKWIPVIAWAGGERKGALVPRGVAFGCLIEIARS